MMTITIEIAEKMLENAGKLNPGDWVSHSKYVALACKNLAEKCPHLNADLAYIYGLLHDIGRFAGKSSEKHLIDGYKFCSTRGWEKAAQICISHAFMVQDISTSIGVFDISLEDFSFMQEFVKNAMYDDYDLLVQLCDGLALPTGFCLLEKRCVDVALRYGTNEKTVLRWRRVYDIKLHFEKIIGESIYNFLPGVIENTFK